MNNDFIYRLNEKVFLDAENIFPEFEFQQHKNGLKSGNNYRTDQSFGGSNGKVFIREDQPYYFLDHTKPEGEKAVSFIKYLQETGKANDYYSAIKYLADHVGLKMSEKKLTKEERIELKKFEARESLNTWFRKSLSEAEVNHIKSRKYTMDEIGYDNLFPEGHFTMDLGRSKPYKAVEEYLKENNFEADVVEAITEEFKNDKNIGFNHTLSIPSRDRIGRINGFWFRDIKPDCQYKYTSTFTKGKSLFYCSKLFKGHDVYLVEGQLDSLILSLRTGLKNVIGLCGNSGSEELFSNFKKADINKIVIVPDGDKGGRKNLSRLISQLYGFGYDVHIKQLPEGMDPDDFFRVSPEGREEKLQEWNKLSVIHGYKFLIDEVLQDKDLDQSIQLEKAKEEIIESCFSIPEIQHESFKNYATKLIGTSREFFMSFLRKHKEHKTEEENIKRIKKGYSKLERHIRTGDRKGILRALKAIEPKKTTEEVFINTSNRLKDRIQNAPPSLSSGYPELDSVFRYPIGSPTIIAGKPSHGKTSFMLNSILAIARTGRKVFFYSFEEPDIKIYTKLVNLYLYELNPNNEAYQNSSNKIEFLQRYIRERQHCEFIHEGFVFIDKLIENGFLEIADTTKTLNDDSLIESIRSLADLNPVVFIDYLQKIPSESEKKSATVSNKLQAIAKELNIALIIGCQYNRAGTTQGRPKLHNLKDASEIEQDANLVLMVFRMKVDMTDEEWDNHKLKTDEDQLEKDSSLQIEVQKNRDGETGNISYMNFMGEHRKVLFKKATEKEQAIESQKRNEDEFSQMLSEEEDRLN